LRSYAALFSLFGRRISAFRQMDTDVPHKMHGVFVTYALRSLPETK
jgi:hypothetical protein